MSEKTYHIRHMNTETRGVAVTDIVSTSMKKAIAEAMQDAKRWNWTETRENMRTRFLLCNGKRFEVGA